MSYITDKVVTNEYVMPYIRFGKGKKTLVILPGLSVQSVIPSAASIEKQYEIFCSEYTVYLFDRREDIPEKYSVSDMAADTAKAIKELGLSDICLFGVSQGGMIALIIAAEYPNLVKKLALGSSAAFVTEGSSAVLKEWLNYALEGNAQKLYLSFGEKLYSEEVFERFKDAFIKISKTVTESDLKRFVTIAKGSEGFDVRDKICRINCPVLAIGDTGDKVLGADSTPAMAELFKNNPCFDMYMYSGFGHAAYDTAPDYTQRLYDFFNK
ncbi:MAG: alpha/beta fold hydrolase [Eubacterium sp.]|nr:alpha/beta fold hydrolase [Eubacterium sp.]